MTGAEFGVAAGIVGAIFGGAANWVRERYKGENDAKKLALQADQQEADQAKQLAPVWQAIVADLKEQAAEMRGEVKALRTQVAEMAVNNARLDTAYGILQERVRVLEAQLADASLRHTTDAATIAGLQAEIYSVRAEMARETAVRDDAIDDLEKRLHEAVIDARTKAELLADANELIASRNEPDYTTMGGPPKTGLTAHETLAEKPKGA